MAIQTSNTYLRSSFYSTQTDDNGIVSIDPLTNKFSNFVEFMKNKSVRAITVTSANEGAADLISYQEYGTHEFWWVVLLANRIQDPINELTAGTIIALPFRADIESYRQSIESNFNRAVAVTLL